MQGQIGNSEAARLQAGKLAGFRVWLLRQMILSARKGADKNRLTALPKPFPLQTIGGELRKTRRNNKTMGDKWFDLK